MKKEVIKITYKECPICGKIFKANTHGRPRKYCSDDCKWDDIKSKRKKERIVEQKCQYCGKTFKANKKKYCSKECANKAKQDQTNESCNYRWYNDIEYRKQKLFKYKAGLGTINLQENKDNDWEKELIRIRALKKQAGLNKRAKSL